MKHIDAQGLIRICKQAAGRYRQVWWADVRDMEAEAAVAVLNADRTFDPAHGAPFRAYAWRAAVLHLRNYLLRAGSPVSGRSRPERMAGLHHAELTEVTDHADAAPSPEAALCQARWARTVRAVADVDTAPGDDEMVSTTSRRRLRASLALRFLHNDRPLQ